MGRAWYYVNASDQEIGPVDSHEIRRLVVSGLIRPDTQIWRDDLPDWVEAGQIRKLFPDEPHRISQEAEPLSHHGGDPFDHITTSEEEQSWERDWNSLANDNQSKSDDPYSYTTETGEQFRTFAGATTRPQQDSSAADANFIDSTDTDSIADGSWETGGTASSVSGTDFAPLISRFVARVLDFLGLMIGTIVILVCMGIAVAAAEGDEDAVAAIVLVGMLVLGLYVFVTTFLIIPLQNAGQHQASWGKRMVGIIVTDINGDRASLGACVGRELAQVPLSGSGFLGLINILWPFFDESRQTLHDKMASTLVLKRAK